MLKNKMIDGLETDKIYIIRMLLLPVYAIIFLIEETSS